MATATLQETVDGGQTKYWSVVLDDLSQYIVAASDAPSAITAATAIQTANAVPVANLATLRQRAATAIATNVTYEGIATPSTAQNTAQILSLSKQVTGIIRMLLDQLNTLNGA